jgi:hypothetical protein
MWKYLMFLNNTKTTDGGSDRNFLQGRSKKILASKFAANFLLLSHTAYGFFFRQNPQSSFLTLMGFQLGGGRRSLIHAVFEEIMR